MAMYFVVLALVPLLGSFITEPAAMTLAALMLRDTLFSEEIPTTLKYATLVFRRDLGHMGEAAARPGVAVPAGVVAAALPPILVAILAFRLL